MEKEKKRRCTCGCNWFEIEVIGHNLYSVTIEDNGDVTYSDPEPYGKDTMISDFVCEKCGKKYKKIEDIPIW